MSSDAPAEYSFIRSTWGSIKNALIGCTMAAFFGLLILAISLFSANSPRAAEETFVMSATESAAVEYYLPYPGILPDSPLYPLKALRDRVRLWTTFDEGRRADLELMYADKRINAAAALFEGNKPSLGVSTASKAEKYLEQAVSRTLEQRGEGEDVKSRLLSLKNSSLKHLELLKNFLDDSSGEDRQTLEEAMRTTQLSLERVSQVLGE